MRIPPYLSFHWGWLLLLTAVEEALQTTFHWNWLGWIDAIAVWGFVQAYWLLMVDRRSRALFWYVAAALLGALTPLGGMRGSFPGGRASVTISVAFVLIEVGISIAGTFVFRYEMQRFFRERGNPGIRLGPWMTLFFNVLYFQYYFHDIAEAQTAGLNITPAAG